MAVGLEQATESAMSALGGHQQTLAPLCGLSALRRKADIRFSLEAIVADG
jgi:hypothetical protein